MIIINSANLSEQYKCIEDFLLDIDCLDALDNWVDKFNIFDILRISKAEIRHSNMIAWLLNPNESHGLSESILLDLLQVLVQKYRELLNSKNIDIITTSMLDYHSFNIYREWNNIDILAVSDAEKFLVCIENKVDSNEHDEQLSRYKSIIDENYPSYSKIFVYLTPDGRESSDPDTWMAFSYTEFVAIIEKNVHRKSISESSRMLIENYINVIRRYVVKDEKLQKICIDIYNKHKNALDLLFEYKPDSSYKVNNDIIEFLKKEQEKGYIVYDDNNTGKTSIKFSTPFIDGLLPPEHNKKFGFGTGIKYCYEIVTRHDKIVVIFHLCSIGLSEKDKQMSETIAELFTDEKLKEDWKWRRVKTWKIPAYDGKKIIELSDEEADEMLTKTITQISNVVNKSIPKLEKEIAENLQLK